MEQIQDSRISMYKIHMWWLTGEWAGIMRFLIIGLFFWSIFFFSVKRFYTAVVPASGEVLTEPQVIFWPDNAKMVALFKNEQALPEVSVSMEEYKVIVKNTPEFLTFAEFSARNIEGNAWIDYYGKTVSQTHVFHARHFFQKEAHFWGEYCAEKISHIGDNGQIVVTKTFWRTAYFGLLVVLLVACLGVMNILVYGEWARRIRKQYRQILKP